MKTPIHVRALAAIALLAFAIIAVIAGIFAIATTNTATAPVAIALISTIVAVGIAVANRMTDETIFDTFVNLMVIGAIFTVAALARAIPTYSLCISFASINDTGQGIDLSYHRRHRMATDQLQMNGRSEDITWSSTDDATLSALTAGDRARSEILVS